MLSHDEPESDLFFCNREISTYIREYMVDFAASAKYHRFFGKLQLDVYLLAHCCCGPSKVYWRNLCVCRDNRLYTLLGPLSSTCGTDQLAVVILVPLIGGTEYTQPHRRGPQPRPEGPLVIGNRLLKSDQQTAQFLYGSFVMYK